MNHPNLNNEDLDTTLKIVLLMRKKDRPLIAHHIAKGINASPQLIDHHLKRLVEQGIILIQNDDMGTKSYILQPFFYMIPAETSLITLLTPWVREMTKQIIINPENKLKKEEVAMHCLLLYFKTILYEIKATLK